MKLTLCHLCKERDQPPQTAAYLFSIENLVSGEVLSLGFCAQCADADKSFTDTLNELREACQK